MIARLKDANTRSRVHNELADPIDANGVGYDGIIICSCPSRPAYEGCSIDEIARQQGKHPLDAVMDILIETRASADIIEFTMKEENVTLGLEQPFVMIGSDASARAVDGPFSRGKPHPRAYGTMPRVLSHYARDKKLFSLEEAVRKMTSLPAAKLRLKDRGLLRPGAYADVVVFDPETIRDAATFTDPHQYPVGIDEVLVNGHPVIAAGKHTGARPGKVVTL
jgi:N-acyl-D-aspartate/D-glutamate deacylase